MCSQTSFGTKKYRVPKVPELLGNQGQCPVSVLYFSWAKQLNFARMSKKKTWRQQPFRSAKRLKQCYQLHTSRHDAWSFPFKQVEDIGSSGHCRQSVNLSQFFSSSFFLMHNRAYTKWKLHSRQKQ